MSQEEGPSIDSRAPKKALTAFIPNQKRWKSDHHKYHNENAVTTLKFVTPIFSIHL